MRKRIVSVALLLCILLAPSLVFAEIGEVHWRNQMDHSRWTNAMIFGNEFYNYAKPIEIRTAVEQLDDALLLCIDQYNGSYADKLKKLNAAGIAGIPSDISAINFTGSTNHRTFTHRGWNHIYTDNELKVAHPDIRKTLLSAVVDNVFQFSKHISSMEAARKKCDAMCCLLYVTHIIGDRYHSEKYYGAASTLLLADNGESVIHDLEECLPTLLSESDCSSLIRKLKRISGEIESKRHKAKTNDELIEIDRVYALELKNLLKSSLYELLQKQSWFSAVFSSRWTSINY